MELIDKVKKALAEQGIHTEEELLEAIRAQKPVDIGIFVSACCREEAKEIEAAS